MYTRILYATDGSPAAQRALSHARELAERYDAEIILVHVFRKIKEFGDSPYFSELKEDRQKAVDTVIGRAMAGFEDSDVIVHIEPCEGEPSRAIINVARVRNCDLIVMGSRGRSSFEELLLGSVSDKVVRHAPCPVLIVR